MPSNDPNHTALIDYYGQETSEPGAAQTAPALADPNKEGPTPMDITPTNTNPATRSEEVGYRLKAITRLIDRRDQVDDDRLVCDQVIRLAAAAMEWC